MRLLPFLITVVLVISVSGCSHRQTSPRSAFGAYTLESWTKQAQRVNRRAVASRLEEFVWPVKGRLSSFFGRRDGRPHEGIDISAPIGTRVRASASGRVIYSGNGLSGYGNLIVIRHSPKIVSIYAHNSRMFVKRGDVVKRGQRIASVGRTGRASGPHSHFVIRQGGRAVDPMKFLLP
jgi:murein DD-endopeptidase MepM/ murein hydrolase activator NlpD